jgi:hypothetical protein
VPVLPEAYLRKLGTALLLRVLQEGHLGLRCENSYKCGSLSIHSGNDL